MTLPSLRFIGAALALSLLSACGSSDAGSNLADAPLAGAQIGGPFELVNSKGETVRWNDFDGKYRIVYFGYAYCPDVCPYDVQRMMRGFATFQAEEPELAKKVQPLFITVDPERDTPAVVAEFTSAFSDDLMGLTGTPEQIDAAAKAFAVYYSKGEEGPSGYLMDHSRAAYLMGPEGQPIALLPLDVNDKGEAIAMELKRWVS